MNPEKKDFLGLQTPPARLNTVEAGWYLGFPPHDIPILVNAGLLKPLGHPPVNGAKFFATAELAALRHDPRWLARASDAIVAHWRRKNRRRQAIPNGVAENESHAAFSSR